MCPRNFNDILYQTGIGGKRETLCGINNVINVEIVGATHFDYTRRPDADGWNLTVSRFITDLIRNSDTRDNVLAYLQSSGHALFNDTRQVWEVNL